MRSYKTGSRLGNPNESFWLQCLIFYTQPILFYFGAHLITALQGLVSSQFRSFLGVLPIKHLCLTLMKVLPEIKNFFSKPVAARNKFSGTFFQIGRSRKQIFGNFFSRPKVLSKFSANFGGQNPKNSKLSASFKLIREKVEFLNDMGSYTNFR